MAWIIRGPNSREALPAFNTDIREPVNGSFFFRDGEEGPRSIELRVLPHGEVELEETFIVELRVLSGEVDVDPQAGLITLKVRHHPSFGVEPKEKGIGRLSCQSKTTVLSSRLRSLVIQTA